MKRFLSILLLIAMVFTFAACGQDAAPADDAVANTIVYGTTDEYTEINPAINEHCEINVLIFNGLTTHDADDQIIPCLANDWTIEENGTVYTFNLRDDVKWHDGETFTAEDVKFTIEMIQNPDNESENAPNYEDVESIEVIDDNTVKFTLSEPNYAFLEYMSMAILPKHLLEGEDPHTSSYFFMPVGTGPYKVAAHDDGQSITLEKNEDYFLGAPNIDTIIFKIVPDNSAKALQLQSGELNFTQIEPKDMANFEGKDEYSIFDMTTADYRAIMYNFSDDMWIENKDLIPAIGYAIDRNAIVDAVVLGHGMPAYGPLQRNIYNDPSTELYTYDPAKCEELLAAAGCTKESDGYWYRNGNKISFTIYATPSDQVRVDLARICAQQLQAVGLDVSADVSTSWISQNSGIIGWGSPFDADDHMYKIFGTGKGANYSAYSSADFDRFVTEARQSDDSGVRKAAYSKALKALNDNPPYTFICYVNAIYVGDSHIKGINPSTVLGHHGVGIFWNVCDWTIE